MSSWWRWQRLLALLLGTAHKQDEIQYYITSFKYKKHGISKIENGLLLAHYNTGGHVHEVSDASRKGYSIERMVPQYLYQLTVHIVSQRVWRLTLEAPI